MYSTPAAQLSPFPSWRQTVVLSPIVTLLLPPPLPGAGSTQPPHPTPVGAAVEGASEGDVVASCAWAVSRDTANTSNANNNTRLTADGKTLLTGRLLEDGMAAKGYITRRLGNTQRERIQQHESSQVKRRWVVLCLAVTACDRLLLIGGSAGLFEVVCWGGSMLFEIWASRGVGSTPSNKYSFSASTRSTIIFFSASRLIPSLRVEDLSRTSIDLI
jgi:hypothetical protein